MGKTTPKSPPGKNDDVSPAKSGGGTNKHKLAIKNLPTKKEGGERNRPKIVNLTIPDGKCWGWAFQNFYDAKKEFKSLSNRDNMYTIIGGIEFRAFSNLTTKWLKESEFHGWIWAIRIDLDLDGTDNCFPLNPKTTHEAYARKIA
jgi:hypothetical protein